MKYTRFYFYSIYMYYQGKNWMNNDPSFRASMIVGLTFTALLNIIVLCLDYFLDRSFFNRGLMLVAALAILASSHILFVKGGKIEQIVQEFTNDPVNTHANRLKCWLFFALVFLAQLAIPLMTYPEKLSSIPWS